METTYDRLIAAGAPALPAPLSYRISRGDHGDLVVDVVERRGWHAPALIARRRVDVTSLTAPEVEGAVAAAAMDAYAEVRPAITRDDTAAALVGTHGPTLSGVAKLGA